MTIDYTRPFMPPPGPAPPASTNNCLKIALIGCGVIVLIGVIGMAGLVVFLFSLIKNDSVYTEAVRRAQANPQVIAALGSPIETGWWVTGNFSMSGSHGSADIAIPIHGPKGKGSLHVEAVRESDAWRYTRLVVHGTPSGGSIDLLK